MEESNIRNAYSITKPDFFDTMIFNYFVLILYSVFFVFFFMSNVRNDLHENEFLGVEWLLIHRVINAGKNERKLKKRHGEKINVMLNTCVSVIEDYPIISRAIFLFNP